MGEACYARAGTFKVCLSPGRRVVRQTTALTPGTKGPFRVTGGRASGSCRRALDQDRSSVRRGRLKRAVHYTPGPPSPIAIFWLKTPLALVEQVAHVP